MVLVVQIDWDGGVLFMVWKMLYSYSYILLAIIQAFATIALRAVLIGI